MPKSRSESLEGDSEQKGRYYMHRTFLFAFTCLCLLSQSLQAQTDTTLLLEPGQSIHLTYHLSNTDKPLVVLQSGARSHSAAWNALIPLLTEEGYPYFAYDRPGLGESSFNGKSRDGASIAFELRRVLKQLKLEKDMILVGHSMGGIYQALYNDFYPESVRGLIMIDSPDGGWEEGLKACLTQEQNASRDSSLQAMRAGLSEAIRKEYEGGEASFDALSKADFKNKLIIISGGAQNWPPAYDRDCLNNAWRRVQERQVKRGKSVEHLISESSGHGIPFQDPQIIMKALQLLD